MQVIGITALAARGADAIDSLCHYRCIDTPAVPRYASSMGTKSEQLQIRVTAREKATLKRLARAAGQDVSTFVLARVLPLDTTRISRIVTTLRDDVDRRFALAELNDALSTLAAEELLDAVATIDVRGLTPLLQNYVAAMIEQAARARGVRAPDWTRDVEPLDEPHFATPLKSLRLHLLRASPLPFKRRNIFVDASVGARV